MKHTYADRPARPLLTLLLIAALLAGCVTTPAEMQITVQTPAESAAPAAPGFLSRGFGDTNFTNLVTSGDLTVAGTAAVTGATTLTGALTLQGVAVSGPLRYGAATTVVSGTTIAHGLATTPTIALLTAGVPITTPLYITARDATSITVGINDSVSVTTVFWAAGK